ncbi:phytoene desaturase (3,4-didehydrolycopene-forming) [Marchantia polymorpha subsp. ruderalis]|uniref:Amine oxidase domain-containing protein n=2 Tax=Marchantia polymorpha TaxID=3197 RepID=A0AAF6ARY5_MARPO|nr:hypothetical protein MARPO_0001s0297 [Marchantia polymorpha]BBM99205.1 hypothetical protein Mp_1g19580 [Marchantia polymorpha subsp. ruderalis]|eukprot:PTQ50287.1 hypothetical protein MARPO_0001s0297 [Marchantia polymorpha]
MESTVWLASRSLPRPGVGCCNLLSRVRRSGGRLKPCGNGRKVVVCVSGTEGKTKVVIVGGGVGGLAVGGRLAKEGYDVHILEKNSHVGGRLQSLEVEAAVGVGGKSDDPGGQECFRFDTGPSLLLLPQKYRDAFTAMGEDMDDYVTLKKVEPAAYRVFFGEDEGVQSLDLLYDVQKMCLQLEQVEEGAGGAFLRFLANAKEALDKGTASFIERDFKSFWDYADVPRLLPLLKHLSPIELLGQHHSTMRNYFKNPKLQAMFTFQDLYVGLTPYNAPGVFSLLAATELTDGVWYPVGGFAKVRDGLAQAAQKVGATITTKATVKRIDHANGQVQGVTLEDGTFMRANIVVANADLPYVYNSLLGSKVKTQASKLLSSKYSASVIAFQWALSSRLERLSHHNVFLSNCYEESWHRATDASTILERPNFYVHAPSRTDSTVCPLGTDAITVLLPVAHLGEGFSIGSASDDKQIVEAARERVISSLVRSGIGDISSMILSEVVYSPPTWQDSYNLQYGAAFGLAHNLLQLAYFRPDVAEPSIKGLYFAGASTRPGNGVPLVLMGAKVTTNRILEENYPFLSGN